MPCSISKQANSILSGWLSFFKEASSPLTFQRACLFVLSFKKSWRLCVLSYFNQELTFMLWLRSGSGLWQTQSHRKQNNAKICFRTTWNQERVPKNKLLCLRWHAPVLGHLSSVHWQCLLVTTSAKVRLKQHVVHDYDVRVSPAEEVACWPTVSCLSTCFRKTLVYHDPRFSYRTSWICHAYLVRDSQPSWKNLASPREMFRSIDQPQRSMDVKSNLDLHLTLKWNTFNLKWLEIQISDCKKYLSHARTRSRFHPAHIPRLKKYFYALEHQLGFTLLRNQLYWGRNVVDSECTTYRLQDGKELSGQHLSHLSIVFDARCGMHAACDVTVHEISLTRWWSLSGV